MKPQDLKFPFSWEQRKPLSQDGVLFIPWHYEAHEQWKGENWDIRQLFEKQGPLNLEYCSGNGAWIAQKALQHPECLWIAVERRFERVRKIWSKRKNLNLNNLLIVCGEAQDFTKHYLKDSSISAMYTNFPDPWPKERHAKKRLIQTPFAEEMFRVLDERGKAIFATDDEGYANQMISVMQGTGLGESAFEEPYFATTWPGYGDSYFDALWRKKGRMVRYIQFNKK